MMRFATIDGSRRLKNLSFRSFRHPAMMSAGLLLEQRHHGGDVARIVLQVAVHRDDVAAAGVGEAGGKGGGLAEIAAELDDAQPGVRGLQPREPREGVVGAPVVDREDLVGASAGSSAAVSSR